MEKERIGKGEVVAKRDWLLVKEGEAAVKVRNNDFQIGRLERK